MICTNDDGTVFDFKSALLLPQQNSLSTIKTCLITGDPLTYNAVTLQCNHTFNYMPLYKELCAQKTVSSSSSYYHGHDGGTTCPYCRSRHPQLIPYVPLPGVQRVRGVNDTALQQLCLLCRKAGYVAEKGLYCENHHQLLAQTWSNDMLAFMKQKNIPEIKSLLKDKGQRLNGTKKELVLRYFQCLSDWTPFFLSVHFIYYDHIGRCNHTRRCNHIGRSH